MTRDRERQPENRVGRVGAATLDDETDGRATARRVSLSALKNVQRKPGATTAVLDAASRGASSPETALPHADKIQAAFGAHDVSQIKAHVGGTTAAEIGANAYAAGEHVVFDRRPDLHTAAHEAAHVIQQARGINLDGGVGVAGDAYEQQADAVADRVVAGRSAADLLGEPSTSTAREGGVQLDGGTAKLERENDKLAHSSDAARSNAHTDAEIESASALGSTIVMVASRMVAFESFYDRNKDAEEADEAGWQPVNEELENEAAAINADIDALGRYVDYFETRQPEGEWRISGTHREYRDHMRQFQAAWTQYRIAYNRARTLVTRRRGTWDAVDLDAPPLSDRVKGMFDSFGLTQADTSSSDVEKTLPEADPIANAVAAASKAAGENLHAAQLSAHAARMEVTKGADDRAIDLRHVWNHVHEAVRELEQLAPAQRKTHHKLVKTLIHELDALELALLDGEQKDKMFGADSRFTDLRTRLAAFAPKRHR